jgi:hypothetical protein
VALEMRDLQQARGLAEGQDAVALGGAGRAPRTSARSRATALDAPPAGAGEPLWTDDFSNILDVLQIRVAG